MDSAYSLTALDWKNFLQNAGVSLHLAPFLVDGLYKDAGIWTKHLSLELQQCLKDHFDLSLPAISRQQEASDGTVKFRMRFADGMEVETVLIPFFKRFTVCLSTQVGCAMNCSFCYTGTQGLKRNLSAGEIVGQYLKAREWLKEKDPKALKPSIVFMGQGEPLHNVEEVKKAVEVLNDPKLIGVGHRQMTLSTVGLLPNISRLKEFSHINVALSLHSPFEDQRKELIPLTEKFSIRSLLSALDEVPLLKRQFITFEYLLIKDFNVSLAHADELARLLGGKKALINLIPFNPFPGSEWRRPDAEEIETFKRLLVDRKLRVMVRNTKGDEILAACGQLKIKELARNYAE